MRAVAAAEALNEQKRLELVAACERKQQEKIELQLVLARVHEQIEHIRSAHAGVISELSGQLEKQQSACKELGALLEAKQKETTILTVQTHSLQRAMSDALEQATVYARHHETAQQESTTRGQKIDELQSVVTRITESQVEVAQLMNQLAEQQDELARRRNVYAKMQKVQAKLEKARKARDAHKEQSAEHARLLAQMNEFGSKVLQDYKQLQTQAHNAHQVNYELAGLLKSLRSHGEQGLERSEVIRVLDQAFKLLQQRIPEVVQEQESDEIVPHPDLLEDAFLRN